MEVLRDKVKDIKLIFAEYNVPLFVIGKTMPEARLQMNDVIDVSVEEAKYAWEQGLRERLL